MKNRKITQIMAIITVIAFMASTVPATASNNISEAPFKTTQKVSPAPILNVFCVIELAQNSHGADSGDLEAEIVENCCSAADNCKVELERVKADLEAARNDPPEIPAKSWFMMFPWFRDLSPSLQTLIGTTVSLLLVVGLTYIGALAEQNQ